MGRMDYFIVVSKFQDIHIYIYIIYSMECIYYMHLHTDTHARNTCTHARTDRQADRQTDTDTDTDMSVIETKIQTYKMKWK